jgi:hypothetical protein
LPAKRSFSVRSGSGPRRAPLAWSIVVTSQRPQGFGGGDQHRLRIREASLRIGIEHDERHPHAEIVARVVCRRHAPRYGRTPYVNLAAFLETAKVDDPLREAAEVEAQCVVLNRRANRGEQRLVPLRDCAAVRVHKCKPPVLLEPEGTERCFIDGNGAAGLHRVHVQGADAH